MGPAPTLTNMTPLNGTNFSSWKEELDIWFREELDLALCEDAPIALIAQGDNDPTLAERTSKYEGKLEMWGCSNRLVVKVMKNNITPAIRGAIPTLDNAKKYLANIEEQFKSSSKAEASTLIMKMVSTKYSGSRH